MKVIFNGLTGYPGSKITNIDPSKLAYTETYRVDNSNTLPVVSFTGKLLMQNIARIEGVAKAIELPLGIHSMKEVTIDNIFENEDFLEFLRNKESKKGTDFEDRCNKALKRIIKHERLLETLAQKTIEKPAVVVAPVLTMGAEGATIEQVGENLTQGNQVMFIEESNNAKTVIDSSNITAVEVPQTTMFTEDLMTKKEETISSISEEDTLKYQKAIMFVNKMVAEFVESINAEQEPEFMTLANFRKEEYLDNQELDEVIKFMIEAQFASYLHK